MAKRPMLVLEPASNGPRGAKLVRCKMRPLRSCLSNLDRLSARPSQAVLIVAVLHGRRDLVVELRRRIQSFNRDIRPILSDTCFRCHGPYHSSRMGSLRLDIRDEAIKPRRSGSPGSPKLHSSSSASKPPAPSRCRPLPHTKSSTPNRESN